MPRKGRKPELPSDKEKRGTLQPSRDTYEVLTTPVGVVRMPDGLPMEAHDIWDEYADICMSMGTLKAADVHSFAQWCVLTAQIRMTWTDILGAPVPASTLQQWRTLGEMFGLAGEKSRIVLKVKEASASKQNPWANHGRKS